MNSVICLVLVVKIEFLCEVGNNFVYLFNFDEFQSSKDYKMFVVDRYFLKGKTKIFRKKNTKNV